MPVIANWLVLREDGNKNHAPETLLPKLQNMQRGLRELQGKHDSQSEPQFEGKDEKWVMTPVPGAVEAYHRLAELFDTYILSTSPWNNPSAWSDKLEWVKKYNGERPISD